MAPNCARARYYWCTSQAWPLGSLRSLFAPLIRPANAGMVFNGCAVVFGESFGSAGLLKEPGSRDAVPPPSASNTFGKLQGQV